MTMNTLTLMKIKKIVSMVVFVDEAVSWRNCFIFNSSLLNEKIHVEDLYGLLNPFHNKFRMSRHKQPVLRAQDDIEDSNLTIRNQSNFTSTYQVNLNQSSSETAFRDAETR